LAEGDIMLAEKLDLYSDKYIAQGEKVGEKKGMLKIAKKMLARGMDIKEIAELTELPLETIQNLQKKPKGKQKVA
jgi:predicted transposase YdaD